MAAAQCTELAAKAGWKVQDSLATLLSTLSDEQAGQLLHILQVAASGASQAKASSADENPHVGLVDKAFFTLPNVACLEPRGRWDLLFTPSALLFRNKKGVVNVVRASEFEQVRRT